MIILLKRGKDTNKYLIDNAVHVINSETPVFQFYIQVFMDNDFYF